MVYCYATVQLPGSEGGKTSFSERRSRRRTALFHGRNGFFHRKRALRSRVPRRRWFKENVTMIDFDEELKKYVPSMEISEAEEAVLSREISDAADVIERILQEKKEL